MISAIACQPASRRGRRLGLSANQNTGSCGSNLTRPDTPWPPFELRPPLSQPLRSYESEVVPFPFAVLEDACMRGSSAELVIILWLLFFFFSFFWKASNILTVLNLPWGTLCFLQCLVPIQKVHKCIHRFACMYTLFLSFSLSFVKKRIRSLLDDQLIMWRWRWLTHTNKMLGNFAPFVFP